MKSPLSLFHLHFTVFQNTVIAKKVLSLNFSHFLGKKKRDTGYEYQHYQQGYERNSGYVEPEKCECGTIEDCFDLPCPKFGGLVKLKFTRRGPPTRNDYDEIRRRYFQSRQTGEGFTTAAPPDCRVISY